MRLAEFNALPQAQVALAVCCSSLPWARRLAGARPFDTVATSNGLAGRVLAELEGGGDRSWAGRARLLARDQVCVATAGVAVPAELAAGNRVYDEWFGHVYLVSRTSGRFVVLCGRLGNDPVTACRAPSWAG